MEDTSFTVLLVEDDLNDIFLVKRAFKMAQIPNPLQVVTDGHEAISYLSGTGKYKDRETYPLPRLIVTDIKMPRISGFEMLEWVKNQPGSLRRIPVIIVSSSDNPGAKCCGFGPCGASGLTSGFPPVGILETTS